LKQRERSFHLRSTITCPCEVIRMDINEFIAAVAAIHKYMEEHAEKPIEIRRELSYWKILSRSFGW